ncbi:MAG TPA: 2-C-methyl-D-erythritol 4-phosphate cytidylyltransferase [Taishania sp.]|nr:2-C-methyl-D-erythritol 4-phosphate cytidylyltransferase [Taishania sp.]
MKKTYVIIVAGGSGSRMGTELPKQFHILNGKPVLMHTIERFAFSKSRPQIFVVLNEAMVSTWDSLCINHSFQIPHKIVLGGQSRFQSVRNGLQEITKLELNNMKNVSIAVHDAARPLIESTLIDTCFESVDTHVATVLAVQSTNSIRKGTQEKNTALKRENIWVIQTPQTFRGDVLEKSFKQEESAMFTDDASVVEKLGYPIYLIEGDHKNIKITYAQDIQIAQLLLS